MRIESHNNFNSIIRSVFLGNSATGDDGGKERQFFLRYTIFGYDYRHLHQFEICSNVMFNFHFLNDSFRSGIFEKLQCIFLNIRV